MSKKRAKTKKRTIKKVRLHPAAALHVPVPKGHVPVLAVQDGAIKVIPVKRRTFADWLRGL